MHFIDLKSHSIQFFVHEFWGSKLTISTDTPNTTFDFLKGKCLQGKILAFLV